MKTKPSLLQQICGVACLGLAALLPTAQAEPPPSEPVTIKLVPSQKYVEAGAGRDVILEVELQARRADTGQRSPMNVALVLDRSGSMEGAKMEKARQAASVALDRLQDNDYFSLVVYNDKAELLIPPQRVGTRANREALRERIYAIRPYSGTALYAGVQLGAKQLREYLASERVNRAILLSDGLANVGPASVPELAELGRKLRAEGMSVTTIGVGDDFHEDLMTRLAEASNANYYYVQDAEKLPQILAQELGTAGCRVASRVRVRIEVMSGLKVKEVLGHPEIRCEGSYAEIELPELYGADRRLYHLRCTTEGHAQREVQAKAKLGYDDVVAKSERTQTAQVTVQVTENREQAAASVDNETARNVAVVKNRLAKDEAVRLADDGRPVEAAALLRQQATANAAAPAAQQIPAAPKENQQLRIWAEELEGKDGLSKRSRKAVQYENYQDKMGISR